MIDALKILSNEHRLEILRLLKNPRGNFDPEFIMPQVDEIGVCARAIHMKTGLSQSTVSSFLNGLARANLLLVTREGQWTFYKRNEKAIQELSKEVAKI